MRGPNLDLLIAGAYFGSYYGALVSAAEVLGSMLIRSTVRALAMNAHLLSLPELAVQHWFE